MLNLTRLLSNPIYSLIFVLFILDHSCTIEKTQVKRTHVGPKDSMRLNLVCLLSCHVSKGIIRWLDSITKVKTRLMNSPFLQHFQPYSGIFGSIWQHFPILLYIGRHPKKLWTVTWGGTCLCFCLLSVPITIHGHCVIHIYHCGAGLREVFGCG